MKNITEEKNYSLKDLNRAFNVGLESAIRVLENSQELTPNGIERLIQPLKEMSTMATESEKYLIFLSAYNDWTLPYDKLISKEEEGESL